MARKGLLDIILDSIFDDEWKGKYGEKLTERELKWAQLFGRKGKTLRNVYLPTSDGGHRKSMCCLLRKKEYSYSRVRTTRVGFSVMRKAGTGQRCSPTG